MASTKPRLHGIPTLCRLVLAPKVGCYVSLKCFRSDGFNVMNNGNLNEITTVPPQRGGRRKATRGVFLDKMTKAMGRRMPISIVEGNLRPHESVQVAKFASEVGVIVRSQVPTLTHWNQYMEQTEHFDGFM